MIHTQNYKTILETTNAKKAQLVAVSKTRPNEALQALYDRGQRHFGENRVQEMVEKAEALPQDIYWHQIGSLQRNKVKYIAPFVHLIHSIDSLRLLQEIDRQAARHERIIDGLLQFHIAEESSKQGLTLATARELLESDAFTQCHNVRLVGVMGMATFTSDEAQVRNEFEQLHRIFRTLKEAYFATDDAFKELSMGMSGDYQLALEAGSTMVRVGSLLFE